MTELPTRSTETLHERLLVSAEALIDLVGALPADLGEHLEVSIGGSSYRDHDLSVLLESLDDAPRCMEALGGEWEQTTQTTSSGDVVHRWSGEHHGASVRLVAVILGGGEPRG